MKLSPGLRTAFVLIMLIGTFFTFIPAEKADAGPMTVVQTAITPPSQTVDVDPASEGLVMFSGTCEATTYSPLPINVMLQASCDAGTAVVTPASFVLTNTQSIADLQIAVRIPPLTSNRVSPVVRVDGTFTQGGTTSQVGGSEAQVVVKKFFRLNIYSDKPYTEVTPGEQTVFNLKLLNLANCDDTFIFEVSNQEKLVDQGWTLSPIPKTTLEEKGQRTITFTVQSPQDWHVWQNKVWVIEMNVKSETSQGTVKEPYSLYVRTKGVHIPGFDPIFSIVALAFVAAMVQRKRIAE